MKIILFLLYCVVVLLAQEVSSVKVSYFVDTNSSMNVQDMKNVNFQSFTKQKFGFTEHTYWLKVENKANNDVDVFEFLDARLDSISFYSSAGKLLYSMGDMLPFTQRYYNDSNSAFPLNPHKIYFFKISAHNKMNLEYKVWQEKEYLVHLQTKNLLKAFYFGALSIMLLYNLIIYLFLRDRAILEYVIYHTGFLYLMVYYTGVSGQILFKSASNLDASIITIHIAAFCSLMATQFARSYLNTQKLVPKLDKIMLLFIALNTIYMLMSLFNVAYHINHILFNITLISMSLFLLYISLYVSIVTKSTIALFYFFAWFIMMIGIIFTSLVMLGYIAHNDFTANIFQIGSLLEILLLSMGLAYRYKISQDEIIKKTSVIQEQTKLAAMGEMLQNITHQWRQPLSDINAVAMKIDIDFYKKVLTQESLENDLLRIENTTEHMSNTIESFNNYFKMDKKLYDTSLENMVQQSLTIMQTRLKEINVEVSVNDASVLSLYASELIQVLLAILNNAVDVLMLSPKPKNIFINISKNRITIEDNAGGIQVSPMEKIFEPYFTTKFKSNGIGIGLYMAKILTEQSLEGTLNVSNTQNGARFTIKL